jgi:heme/copper-type cytochrome/quinol oxidase subunit 2
MTFFALVNVLISYLLSVKKQGLIYFLLVAVFLEAGLIWLFHDTFYQVLAILIGVSITLFISLCLYLYLSNKRGSPVGQVQEEVFNNYPRL